MGEKPAILVNNRKGKWNMIYILLGLHSDNTWHLIKASSSLASLVSTIIDFENKATQLYKLNPYNAEIMLIEEKKF